MVDGLGTFAEIEVIAENESDNPTAQIEKIAKEIGVVGEPILESYLEMLLARNVGKSTLIFFLKVISHLFFWDLLYYERLPAIRGASCEDTARAINRFSQIAASDMKAIILLTVMQETSFTSAAGAPRRGRRHSS